MRRVALLLLPWIIFSPWFGFVIYLMGFTIDALIVLVLPIVICTTVNLKTYHRIFREDAASLDQPQSHQEPDLLQNEWLANLNRPPVR